MMRIETDRRAKLYCTTTSLVSFSVLVRAATRQRIKSSQWTPSPDQNIYHKNKLMIILNYTLLLYRLFVQVSRYIYTNLQPLQGIGSQKKIASTIFCKMKSRLYKIDCCLAEEDRFYHNQAPHPGNIWHKRSGSIASCISCWTYKGIFRLILHQICYHILKYQSHPLHKLWPPTQKNCKSFLAWIERINFATK